LGGSVPIPGGTVTLNSGDLLSQAKSEQDALRSELKTVLDELTYEKLLTKDANMTKTTADTLSKVPVPLFVG